MIGGFFLTLKEDKTKDYFSNKMFFRALFPTLISYIGLALGDIADAVVVGRKIGVTGLAAVSLALPIYMFINVIMHGFGAGGSIVYSRLLGEGKYEEAIKNFNIIFRVLVFIGILTSLLGNVFLIQILNILGVNPNSGALFQVSKDYVRIIITGAPFFMIAYLLNYYLRSDGNEKSAGIIFTISNIVDISLNIIFVLIFNFGAIGAALSTIIGQILAILLYLPVVINKNNILSFSKKTGNIKEAIYCFKLGFSSSIQYLFLLIFILFMNNLLIYISGDIGVAIFDVIQNVSFMVLYLYEATAKSGQNLISTYCGERNFKGQIRVFRLTILFGSLFGLIATAVVIIFAREICMFFGIFENSNLIIGSNALRIYSFSILIAGLNILVESYYQACEKEKNAFIIALLRGGIVLIPITLIFAYFKSEWIWGLFVVTELVSLLAFILWLIFNREEKLDTSRIFSTMISNKDNQIESLLKDIDKFLQKWNAKSSQIYFARMTLEEVCIVIMNNLKENRYGYIQITVIALEDYSFELHIRDNAKIFNPFEIEFRKDKDLKCEMDLIGIFVIKNKVKDVFYRQYKGFNTLVVRI